MSAIIKGAGGTTLRRYFVGALVAALAVSGGLFAYAYTIASTSFTVGGVSTDFGNITAHTANTVPSYTPFGSYRGGIGAGNLFDVVKNYQGDIAINVYLDNLDQIGYKYGMFMVKLRLMNSANQSMDVDGVDKPLSLHNGVVSFTSKNMTAGTTYYIYCVGGVYRTFPWAYLTGSGGSWAPSFTAEILQAGL
ncbi:hypothetical protein ES703_43367 [subsurface metagenome]